MLKQLTLGTVLLGAAALSHAEAPGGPNCGWGNMLFAGQSGIGPHMVAITTNGTSGNATFGMTSGTNGCSVDGELTYGGEAMIGLANNLDEFVADASQGQGEVMTAVAVSMGIEPSDRAYFGQSVNTHFDQIFSSADVTAEQVFGNIVAMMKADARLSRYVAA